MRTNFKAGTTEHTEMGETTSSGVMRVYDLAGTKKLFPCAPCLLWCSLSFFCLHLSAFVFLSWVCAAPAAGFRAGAATANITPPLGIEINGGTAPSIATHVHDELHARALVLDDGATRLAFVVVDNCLIERALFDEAKALIFQHTGIA